MSESERYTHSHVVKLRSMSAGDVVTISSIILDPDYSFNAFACIVALLEDDKVELLGYIAKNNYIFPVEIEIQQ